MNPAELIKLESWIATNVMGWRNEPTAMELDRQGFHPTTDPASALSVLEKCVQKVATASIEIYQGCDEAPEYKRFYGISVEGMKEIVMHESFATCICLLARKLFDNIEARRPPAHEDDGIIRPQRD